MGRHHACTCSGEATTLAPATEPWGCPTHPNSLACIRRGCSWFASRLHEAGQERARQRAERVQALRVDRTHPLVLAVMERWDVEPADASDVVAALAVSAVQAVVNCLASTVAKDGAS